MQNCVKTLNLSKNYTSWCYSVPEKTNQAPTVKIFCIFHGPSRLVAIYMYCCLHPSQLTFNISVFTIKSGSHPIKLKVTVEHDNRRKELVLACNRWCDSVLMSTS